MRSQLKVLVNGQPLMGVQLDAQAEDGRVLVPIVPVARALGDAAFVDPVARLVTVRRASGVLAEYEPLLGQVRENGVPVLAVPGAVDTLFPADPDQMRVPLEILNALLEVSAVADAEGGVLRISRGLGDMRVARSGLRSFAELYSASYAYSANLSQPALNHNLQTLAEARLFDGRLQGNTTFHGSSAVGQPLALQYGLLSYERPGGQSFLLGDLSTGSGISLFAAQARGAQWNQPVGPLRVSTFAAAARSNSQTLDRTGDQLESARFDTPMVGGDLKWESPQGGKGARLGATLAGQYFNGPTREGGMLAAAFDWALPEHQFRAELGVGRFRQGPGAPQNVALLLSLRETLTPHPTLSLTGTFTHLGQGFLGPQAEGFLQPMTLLQGGASWRPLPFLSLGTSVQRRDRLDRADGSVDTGVSYLVGLNGGRSWPSLTFSHSEAKVAEGEPQRLTMLGFSYEVLRTQLFSTLTHQVTGAQPPATVVTAGLQRSFGTVGVRAVQSVTGAGGLSGSVDAMFQNFFAEWAGVDLGLSYTAAEGPVTPGARLGVFAKVFGKQQVNLNYTQLGNAWQGMVSISGPLFEAPRKEGVRSRSIEQLATAGSLTGRIYQDVDMDGAYTPGADRALPGVEVMVDRNNTVRTDANGAFEVDNLTPGAHDVSLNLLSVRADLSLLTSSEQQVQLLADRDTALDFRLVRTGRLRGLVWLDRNEDGVRQPAEQVLADARVVAGDRDTLTDGDGEFLLGDLPPGQHLLLVDAKTLPDGLEPSGSPVPVTVQSSQETAGVLLPVRPRPLQVQVKEF